MTLEIDRSQFRKGIRISTLVLVDTRSHHLFGPAGSIRADTGGILRHCRAALLHARRLGTPVMFVRDRYFGSNTPTKAGRSWIKGLEPQRNDRVFERDGESCYDGPYFREVIETAGRSIAVAGFLGSGGCLATAVDALCAGHAITFLKDAIVDDMSARVIDVSLVGSLAAFRRFEVQVKSTVQWIAAPVAPPLRTADRKASLCH